MIKTNKITLCSASLPLHSCPHFYCALDTITVLSHVFAFLSCVIFSPLWQIRVKAAFGCRDIRAHCPNCSLSSWPFLQRLLLCDGSPTWLLRLHRAPCAGSRARRVATGGTARRNASVTTGGCACRPRGSASAAPATSERGESGPCSDRTQPSGGAVVKALYFWPA